MWIECPTGQIGIWMQLEWQEEEQSELQLKKTTILGVPFQFFKVIYLFNVCL